MNILVFAEGPSVPATRFRITQYLPLLRSRGHLVRVLYSHPAKYSPRTTHWFVSGIALVIKIAIRILQLMHIRWADVVIIQREMTPYAFGNIERFVQRLKKKVLFDFDDAVYLLYRNRADWFGRFIHEGRFRRIIHWSSIVTVGNEILAAYAQTENQDVRVLPTAIDTDTFRPRESGSDQPLVIGWMGSSTNIPYLEIVKKPLQTITPEFPDIVFRVVSDHPVKSQDWPGVHVEWIQWSAQTEIAELQRFSVGLMPLPDTPWTRGKCGFKLLQYMATGIPVVASPVGVNARIVIQGVNGYVAETDADWITALRRLIKDPQLRHQLGTHGRQNVTEQYSTKAIFPRLLAALTDLQKM